MAAAFRSVVEPRAGSGVLHFFRDGERDREASATFRFLGGAPWHLSGRQPFAWDYLEPSGERDYGLIVLVLARSVTLEQTARDLSPIPVPGQTPIFVQTYRVQDDELLPAPGAPLTLQQIVGQPTRWDRGQDPFADSERQVARAPSLDYATIQPYPNGVRLQHEGGKWSCQIAAPLAEPAAFAFDVSVLQPFYGYRLLVVRTPNVRLTGGRVIEPQEPDPIGSGDVHGEIRPPGPPERYAVEIFDHVVDPGRLGDVPVQGTVLDPQRYPFRVWDEFEQWLSPEARRAVIVAETIIGFIPYVGALYDIAQLAYAATTGRNFWGETMHEADYLVLGIVAVLPVAFATRRLTAVVGRLSRSNRLFKSALAESTTRHVLERIDRDFLEALQQVPLREQEALVAAADKLSSGAVSAKQVLRQFDDAVRVRFLDVLERLEVAKTFERHADRLLEDPTFKEAARGLAERETEFYAAYRAYKAGATGASSVLDLFDQHMAAAARRFADEQRLLTVFTDDFQGFRLEPLRTRYLHYRAEGKTLSAVQWAKAQTTGRYREALVAALGREYVELVNRTLGERFIYEVTEAQRQAFEAILSNPNAQTYAELRKLASDAGIGRLFEVDHILEKRFLKSIRVGGEVPDEADFLSILVPKNPAVARQLPGYAGIYTHTVKTSLLRELIPHGSEDLFTLQQWWDAHVFALKSLGADPGTYMKRLADTFADVAASTGERFLARFDQTADMFDAAKGWRGRRRVSAAATPLPSP
jgi:hypothetical protein